MTEPDVTLTDYALAVECAVFAYLLGRGSAAAGPLRLWWVLFFGSASAASLFGGTVHGFFLDEAILGHRILWPATLIAIGTTALAGWAIGARILCSESVARWVVRAAFAELLVYVGVVLALTQEFRVAVLDYLPAALFLLISTCVAYGRERARSFALVALGLVATFVAAAIQQLGIAVHPVYFNHNALYHALQFAALFAIFWGAYSGGGAATGGSGST